ncbi:proton-coupled folate transporter-like [Branchiostoma lanceolatum]|uniref:proton-coupled folate transporter-like n=1 Tax=Branchiostoma lanceolatum TaxID=7740 RepID=UPI003451EC46
MPQRRRRQVNSTETASSDDDVPDVDYRGHEDYSDDDDNDDDDFDYVRPYCAVTVEPMLFLYCTAIYMYQPIYQLYLFNVVANDTSPYWQQGYCDPNMTYFNESDPDYLDDKYLTDEVTRWDTIITLTGTVPGLFTAVILGTMSDQLGRKINMILGCAAGILQSGLGLMVIFLELPVWAFIPGSIISGLSGGSGVFFGACYSYIVDIARSNRETTFRIAILDTIVGMASMAGTVVAGIVLTELGYPNGVRGPFAFLFAAYIACMLYAIFFLRETQPTDWKNVQLFSKRYFTDAVKLLRKKNVSLYGKVTNGWNKRLILYLLAGGFYFAQADGVVGFPVILTSAPPFCWTPLRTGVLQAALSACGLTSLFGILILQKYLSYPTMTQVQLASFFYM